MVALLLSRAGRSGFLVLPRSWKIPLSHKEIITSSVAITLFGHLDKNLYVFSGGLGVSLT